MKNTVQNIVNICGEEMTLGCEWRTHTMEASYFAMSGAQESEICFLTQGARQTDCQGASTELVGASNVKLPSCLGGNWPLPGKLNKAQEFVATEISMDFWNYQLVVDPADPTKFCLAGTDPSLPAIPAANNNGLGIRPTLQQLDQLHASLDYVLTINETVILEGPLSELTGYGPGSTSGLSTDVVGGFLQCCGNIQLPKAIHFCDDDVIGFCLVTRCDTRLAFPSVGDVENANAQIYDPTASPAVVVAGIDVMRIDMRLHGLLKELGGY